MLLTTGPLKQYPSRYPYNWTSCCAFYISSSHSSCWEDLVSFFLILFLIYNNSYILFLYYNFIVIIFFSFFPPVAQQKQEARPAYSIRIFSIVYIEPIPSLYFFSRLDYRINLYRRERGRIVNVDEEAGGVIYLLILCLYTQMRYERELDQ